MATLETGTWAERIQQTLARYDEPLLRQVSDNLFRPRNQWPADELVARGIATVGNAAAVDRKLRVLEPGCRCLLALIAHSRQPRWRVGSLLEMLAVLGETADMRCVLTLLESGLLYPVLAEGTRRLKNFEQWLGTSGAGGPEVFAPPEVSSRAVGEGLGLPACPGATSATPSVRESDGLEWPLRMLVARQLVAAGPLRRTQSAEFFKRDLDRLRGDALLGTPPADHLLELPDRGLLAVELALALGMLTESHGEITAGPLPASWDDGLFATLDSLWAAWPNLQGWDPQHGWHARQECGTPFPSAGLAALLLLSRLPQEGWAEPRELARWVVERHPFWTGSTTPGKNNGDGAATPVEGLLRFLLGVAYEWRLVQAAKDPHGDWAIRLSPYGRGLLGVSPAPAVTATYPQTILVQPNLEIIAYRQGLTPALCARLGQFAAWKSLGSACTLQLQPDTVYRALEAGESFETIKRTLDQHGMRPTPPAVIESLRTWSNKRERLSVFASATLFEFASNEDLQEALARGLPATPVSDRLAVVQNESDVDFRHFRLTATRDYALPPEPCIQVADDGVTLIVDLTKSDLLLESQLQQFADPEGVASSGGKSATRRYVLTPASLARARAQGIELALLEEWFLQRTGAAPSAAARLLMSGAATEPPFVRHQLVLHVSQPEIADGLCQWPETRPFIQERLGPTALAIAEEHLDELRRRLEMLGMCLPNASQPSANDP